MNSTHGKKADPDRRNRLDRVLLFVFVAALHPFRSGYADQTEHIGQHGAHCAQ
jgi:hypothetical protein